MAKYHITHSCGHEITHDIVGRNVDGERERRADWLSEQPCMECKREAERAEAAAATSDMIPLTGSAKQIAWATKIRAEKVAEVDAVVAKFVGELTDEQQARLDAEVAALRGQADAGWWIDHRGLSIQRMMAAAQTSRG